ncbi:MAG TPA: polysaccharide biosynthesis/export family protein [Pyrinomonadaceae bacterium]|nr:polysaccharide biosynthesis/export family protein [Pyrinomonadaceae bacterium]
MTASKNTDAVPVQPLPKPDLKNHAETARLRRTSDVAEQPQAKPSNAAATIEPRTSAGGNIATPATSNLFANYAPVSLASTQIYRVGANDVLDIQIAGKPSRESTLFTLDSGGLLEYPLAGEPIAVAGLTTPEISVLLRQRIRVFENPAVVVTVRDFASHAVTVTGFVASPGRKILRREAVPLYAMLAEALVLPEAGRATITRAGRAPIVADLKDANHAATLVTAGDIIKVSGVPPGPIEFFFVGGAISSPGQKPYHAGLTVTQALLASGGITTKADARIRISRLGPNGRLISEDHNLRKIQTGKSPDPVLEKGDRIEVIPIN